MCTLGPGGWALIQGWAIIIFSIFSASEDIIGETKYNTEPHKTKCKSEHEQSINSNCQSKNLNPVQIRIDAPLTSRWLSTKRILEGKAVREG